MVPSFSIRWAEGSKKTSVLQALGSTPGRFQLSVVSELWISMQTSQSSLSRAARILLVLGKLFMGFTPTMKPPRILPWYILSMAYM